MGLDIKSYSFSYSMLHKIRQLALDYEGIDINIFDFYYMQDVETKFAAIIHHSDCDGVYVSKSSKQYDKLKKKYKGSMFGDLDKLKEEVQILKPYVQERFKDEPSNLCFVLKAFNRFYDDVMSTRKILEFR